MLLEEENEVHSSAKDLIESWEKPTFLFLALNWGGGGFKVKSQMISMPSMKWKRVENFHEAKI